MNSETQTAPPFSIRSLFVPIAGAVFIAVILVLLYAIQPFASGYGSERVTILHFAKYVWNTGEDWQHCYLVPLAIAGILYYRRRELSELPVKGSVVGLAALIFALFVYCVGFRADNVYLGYASFQLLVGGLIFWLLGWRWMLALSFPWAFLMFLYPLTFMDNFVAFPLRLIMSEASVNVLNFIGLATVKSGTAIISASDPLSGLKAGARFQVDVADPCSGIRSLFALMMVTALYAYFTQRGLVKQWVLFLCSIPLAVLGNLVRIIMLTIGTLVMGSEKAIGTLEHPSFFHMMAGYVVFAVALSGMLGVGTLINLDWATLWSRWRSGLRKATVPSTSTGTNTPSKRKEHKDEY